MKKLISLLTVIALIITLGPWVYATSIVAQGKCGESLSWQLDSAGVLTVSGSGTMKHYTYSINGPWQSHAESIKKVIIEPGVTGIGDYAFLNCINMTSLSLPSTVEHIGKYAFCNCHALKAIILPEGVKSVGPYSFAAGHSVSVLSLPSTLTVIPEAAFEEIYNLTSVTVPEGVTHIEKYAFAGCTGAKVLNLPASLESIGNHAFYRWRSLEEIHVADVDAWVKANLANKYAAPSSYNTETIGLYLNNEPVTDITIPHGVTTINTRAFASLSSLQSVTIPASVEVIESCAFYKCSGLLSIDIPDSVHTIGQSAFGGCSSVKTVTIPDSVTVIDNAVFSQCSDLRTVSMGPNVTIIKNYAFAGCSNLTAIHLPDSVTEVGAGAFNECRSLCSIEIPQGVTTTKPFTFSNCNSLKTIILPKNLTTVGDKVLDGTNGLQAIYFRGTESQKNALKYTFMNFPFGDTRWHYDVRDAVVTPTCEDAGYSILWCSCCDEPSVIAPVPATGHTYKDGVCTVCGQPGDGYSIGGIIISDGTEEGPVTLELLLNDTVLETIILTGTSVAYQFDDVGSGDYTLRVSKKDHAYRFIPVAVEDANVLQSIRLCFTGDVTGDGQLNMKDWTLLKDVINEKTELDPIAQSCADVNGDGKINMKDWNRIYEHITETNPLW